MQFAKSGNLLQCSRPIPKSFGGTGGFVDGNQLSTPFGAELANCRGASIPILVEDDYRVIG